MKLASLLTLAAACAFAQSGSVTGFVRERPDFAPVGGATITLADRDSNLVASVITGATGEFTIRDVKFGTYTLAAAKTGYVQQAPGQSISVSSEMPRRTANLTIYASGAITGRVQDELGNPVPGLTIGIGATRSIVFNAATMTTYAEGRFTSEPLVAGRYLVRVSPASIKPAVLTSFTEEEAAQVDLDYGTSYWPGGATHPEAALPVTLVPGASLDIGAIRLRQSPFFRARVSVRDEKCTDGFFLGATPTTVTQREYRLHEVPFQPVSCSSEYLLTGLPSGRYRIRMTSETGELRYAVAEIEAGPDPRPIEMRFQPVLTITGRVTAGEGVTLPPNLEVSVSVNATDNTLGSSAKSDTNRRFTLTNLFGVPSRAVARPPAPFYVREVRYGGQTAPDGMFTPSPGGELEIVLDNQTATLTGAYSGGDGTSLAIVVFRMENGQPQEIGMRTIMEQPSPPSGRFTIPNIPPGDYKVIACTLFASYRLTDPIEAASILEAATSVTLKRGETLDISLKAQ